MGKNKKETEKRTNHANDSQNPGGKRKNQAGSRKSSGQGSK